MRKLSSSLAKNTTKLVDKNIRHEGRKEKQNKWLPNWSDNRCFKKNLMLLNNAQGVVTGLTCIGVIFCCLFSDRSYSRGGSYAAANLLFKEYECIENNRAYWKLWRLYGKPKYINNFFVVSRWTNNKLLPNSSCELLQ